MSVDPMRPPGSGDAVGGTSSARGSASHSLVLAAVILVWVTTGANYVGFALAVETMPPFLMSGTRLILAGLAVLGLLILLAPPERTSWPTRRQRRNVAIMGTLLVVLGQGSVVWSVQNLDAGVAAIVTASMPAWVALAGIALPSERPSKLAFAGVAAGFAGLATLALGEGFGGEVTVAPMLVLVLGMLASAAAILFGRIADLPENSVLSASLQVLFAGVIFLAIAAITGEFAHFELSAVSTRSWASWVCVLVGGSIVGHQVMVWTTRHAAPTLASTFAYMGPIVGLFLSVLIFDEELTPTKLLAASLTVTGALLMLRSGNTRDFKHVKEASR